MQIYDNLFFHNFRFFTVHTHHINTLCVALFLSDCKPKNYIFNKQKKIKIFMNRIILSFFVSGFMAVVIPVSLLP